MTDLLTRSSGEPPAEHPARGHGAVAAGSVFAGTVAAGLVLAVAPTTGRFRPRTGLRGRLRAGELIGHVTGGRGRADEVRCPTNATLRGVLVRAGQLVTAGQGLAWLERPADEPA